METVIVLYVLAFLIFSIRYFTKKDATTESSSTPILTRSGDIVFQGNRAGITPQQIHDILLAHNPYYQSLDVALKKKIISRVKRFMNEKVFIIKDDEVFRSMPVLVCGSAIQLTFGFKDYPFALLYSYPNISRRNP